MCHPREWSRNLCDFQALKLGSNYPKFIKKLSFPKEDERTKKRLEKQRGWQRICAILKTHRFLLFFLSATVFVWRLPKKTGKRCFERRSDTFFQKKFENVLIHKIQKTREAAYQWFSKKGESFGSRKKWKTSPKLKKSKSMEKKEEMKVTASTCRFYMVIFASVTPSRHLA